MNTCADNQIEPLAARALEIVALVHAVCPSASEIVETIGALIDQPQPKDAEAERRSLTSVAARLAAVNLAVLALLGEHDLALADRDDLAAGLAARGIFLPPDQRRPRRGGRG